jgi:hypothetical protein
MQVTVKRTGGYAGLDQTLVSRDLGEMTARKRSGIVRRLKNLSKKAQEAEPQVGADLMTYEVEITEAADLPEHISVVDTGDLEQAPLKQVNDLIEALS